MDLGGTPNNNYSVIGEDSDFVWAKNQNGNLVVGKIYDYSIIKDLEIGDEIIEINGRKISDFKKDELVQQQYTQMILRQ